MINPYVALFEYGSYGAWLVLLVVLFTRFRQRRDLQWLLFAMTMMFPFEWLADNYWMYLNYNPEFTSMSGHFPLFMPFSWGWFFPIIVSVLLTQQKRLARLPVPVTTIIVFLGFFVWDVLIEGWATVNGLWVYWWPEASFIHPDIPLPFAIPLLTAMQGPAYYFTQIWARKNLSKYTWLEGFAIFTGIVLLGSIVEALVGSTLVNVLAGFDPSPYAPDWWLNRSNWFVI